MTFVAHLFYYGSQVVEDNVVMIECSLCLIKTNLIVLIFKKLTCSTKRFFNFPYQCQPASRWRFRFPTATFMVKVACSVIDTSSSVTRLTCSSETTKWCVVKMVYGVEKSPFVNGVS